MSLALEVELYGATKIPQLSALYFDQDYINVSPALRSEKIWCSQITLKHYYFKKVEVNLGPDHRRTRDLTAEIFRFLFIFPLLSIYDFTAVKYVVSTL